MALTAEQKEAIRQQFGSPAGYPKERLGMVEYAPGKRLREADILARVQGPIAAPETAPAAPAARFAGMPGEPGDPMNVAPPAAPIASAPTPPFVGMPGEPGNIGNVPVPIPMAPSDRGPSRPLPTPFVGMPGEPGDIMNVAPPATAPVAPPAAAPVAGPVPIQRSPPGQPTATPIKFTPPGGPDPSQQPLVPGTAAPGQPVMGPTAPFGGVSSDIIAQRNPYQAWTAMRSQAVPEYDPSMGSYAAYEQAIGRGYQPAYGGYMLSSGMEGGTPGQRSFGEYMAQNAATDPALMAQAFGQVAGQVSDPYALLGPDEAARFANFFDPTALGGEKVAGNLINAALAARGGQGSVLNNALRNSMMNRYGMMQASDPTLTGQQSSANFANLLNQWVNPSAAAIQGGNTGIYGGGQTPFTPGQGTFNPPIPAASSSFDMGTGPAYNFNPFPEKGGMGWDIGAAGPYTEPVNGPNRRVEFPQTSTLS